MSAQLLYSAATGQLLLLGAQGRVALSTQGLARDEEREQEPKLLSNECNLNLEKEGTNQLINIEAGLRHGCLV